VSVNEPLHRAATLDVVRAVLAADCACAESAFVAEGDLVTAAEEREGRRRYPRSARPLSIVSMGQGVVVSCYPAWIPWLRATLADRSRDAIFATPTIVELAQFVSREGVAFHGPALSHVCAAGEFRPPRDPLGVAISIVEGEAVHALYEVPGFEHALSYYPDHPRPDIAAAVARQEGDVIGIAGMSADCETLWQIGIEVVPHARGAGIGRALVGRMTQLAFRRGRVPSYTTDVGNVRSRALAASLGYWPAWVELFTRDASSG
jgi:GNAT superfamily N-acetyltransferase